MFDFFPSHFFPFNSWARLARTPKISAVGSVLLEFPRDKLCSSRVCYLHTPTVDLWVNLYFISVKDYCLPTRTFFERHGVISTLRAELIPHKFSSRFPLFLWSCFVSLFSVELFSVVCHHLSTYPRGLYGYGRPICGFFSIQIRTFNSVRIFLPFKIDSDPNIFLSCFIHLEEHRSASGSSAAMPTPMASQA